MLGLSPGPSPTPRRTLTRSGARPKTSLPRPQGQDFLHVSGGQRQRRSGMNHVFDSARKYLLFHGTIESSEEYEMILLAILGVVLLLVVVGVVVIIYGELNQEKPRGSRFAGTLA